MTVVLLGASAGDDWSSCCWCGCLERCRGLCAAAVPQRSLDSNGSAPWSQGKTAPCLTGEVGPTQTASRKVVGLTLYGNKTVEQRTMIGTLAVDGWAVTFGTARRGLGGLGRCPVPPCCTKCNGHYIWNSEEGPGRAGATPSPLLAVPNVTAHPSTAGVPTSYYLMWHYNCLWTLKGLTDTALV